MTQTPIEPIEKDAENGLVEVFSIEAHNNEKNKLESEKNEKEEMEFHGNFLSNLCIF